MLRTTVTLAVCFLAIHSAFAQADETSRRWNKPVTPFRIAGNLYYVGAVEITSYLIVTPGGHFLLDGGFVETAPQIERNITELGFKLTDVKFLLNSHAHCDHAGGLAELKKMTGAKFLASERDAPMLRSGGHGDFRFGDTLTFPPIAPDQIVHDGEAFGLGNQTMIAHLTPGHTKGCTTWTMTARDGGKNYDVVIVGSPNINPGYRLVNNTEYPQIADEYRKTFRVLKSLRPDIFLGAHPDYFNGEAKYARMKAGGANPFIDPEGYKSYIAERQANFEKTLAQQEAEARK